MSNYRRHYVQGGTYFFTINLKDRRKDYLTSHIDELRASWRDLVRKRPFKTIAAVILPDHMHCLWRLPEGDQDFSTRIRLLKSGFTRRLPTDLKHVGRKGERDIWQRRFWEHTIRDENDLETHVNYIHFNPVKHEYVTDPDRWPWSTWHKWKQDEGKVWCTDAKGTFGE